MLANRRGFASKPSVSRLREGRGAVSLSTDNKAARDLAYNPEHHKRTKHVDRRHFFIRECVEDMKITVPLVKTTDNLADFFTKPLPAKTFFTMRNEIMNIKGDHTSVQPKKRSQAY